MDGHAMKQAKDGVIIEVRAKPNSKRFGLFEKDGRLILEVTSPAQEGKANLEIVKGLKRMLGKDVEIVSGLKSREKVILVRDANLSEVSSRLQSQSTS